MSNLNRAQYTEKLERLAIGKKIIQNNENTLSIISSLTQQSTSSPLSSLYFTLWNNLFLEKYKQFRTRDIIKATEISMSYGVEEAYNQREFDPNQETTLTFPLDPNGSYMEQKRILSQLISNKIQQLKEANLNRFEAFAVFEELNFLGLNAVKHVIDKVYPVAEISEAKPNPSISPVAPETIPMQPAEPETIPMQPVAPEFTEPSLGNLTQELDSSDKEPRISWDSIQAENSSFGPEIITDEFLNTAFDEPNQPQAPENVKADIEENKKTFRNLLRGLFSANSSNQSPATSPVEIPTTITRRGVLKLFGAGLVIGTGLGGVFNADQEPERNNRQPQPKESNGTKEESNGTEEESNGTPESAESTERLTLLTELKSIIAEYSALKGKQSYDLLTEDPGHELLERALKIIQKVNLSAQEFQDLKLIRETNLSKFDDDLTRLERIFVEQMCDSDNWIIKLMLDAYKQNPQEMLEKFSNGKFYDAINRVCESMKDDKIEGDRDILNEFDFLNKIVFNPSFIEGILMRECGFRAHNYDPLVCTEITRSIIDSGKWNPGFGSIVNGKIRVGFNHILTFWFLRGGSKNEGGALNNKLVLKYFKEAGVIKGRRFKLCSEFESSVPNPAVNAPTEHKISQMLMNPEDSVRLTLLSLRENLHYSQDTIRQNLEKFKIFNKLLSDQFWVKIVALSNIAGGPSLNYYLKRLATYPGFYSLSEIAELSEESRNEILQNFAKVIKFKELKSNKELLKLKESDKTKYNYYFKEVLKVFTKMHAESVKITSETQVAKLSTEKKKKLMDWYDKVSSPFHSDYALNLNLLLENITNNPYQEPRTQDLNLEDAQATNL